MVRIKNGKIVKPKVKVVKPVLKSNKKGKKVWETKTTKPYARFVPRK